MKEIYIAFVIYFAAITYLTYVMIKIAIDNFYLTSYILTNLPLR